MYFLGGPRHHAQVDHKQCSHSTAKIFNQGSQDAVATVAVGTKQRHTCQALAESEKSLPTLLYSSWCLLGPLLTY
jgi:hypothetical protein